MVESVAVQENCTKPEAGYPARLGLSGKFVENSTKLTCLEITGYRIKYSTVLWLIELQIRRGRKSNYPDFLHIRMARRPN
jgi:hypothetical protein